MNSQFFASDMAHEQGGLQGLQIAESFSEVCAGCQVVTSSLLA